MTTEAIEGNVTAVEDNAPVAPEATEPVAAVEADPAPEAAAERDFEAEAARLVEAEAAQPQARSFADLTEEELAADPRVNGLIQKQRQSAAQQAEAKLRKQAGSDEAVLGYVRRLRDAALDDPEAYERSAAEAIRLNREFQQDQVTEFFTEGLKNLYQVPVDHHERAVRALAAGDRAGYVTAMVDGAVASKTQGLKLADIPESSPLRSEIEAEIKAKAVKVVAAELRAKAIEAQPRIESPPPAPSGLPGGRSMTTAEIDAIDSNTWISMPAEQRRAILASARRG